MSRMRLEMYDFLEKNYLKLNKNEPNCFTKVSVNLALLCLLGKHCCTYWKLCK